MSASPANPSLYQVNTRVLLRGISDRLERQATFDDIPDEALAALGALGFDWVWMLGVWRTGEAGRAISRADPAWREQFAAALPDLDERDIVGSPFSIAAYEAEPAFGGDAALARLRERLRDHGIRLMLDFVPNHVSPGHPWVRERPELLMRGTADDLAARPSDWCRIGDTVFAHGRDPYFPGWQDTIQLDYSEPATRAAMTETLLGAASHCDGLRCDVSMLLLPDVFERTWAGHLDGRTMAPFWPDATAALRAAHPGFTLLAEVYWGLEGRMIEAGFDLAYDKSLYDALRDEDAGAVRRALSADQGWQHRLARFLENHDEKRAMTAFGWPKGRAAALLTFLSPGLRFFHQGQFEGLRTHIPIHLDRGPVEDVDDAVFAFYRTLCSALADDVLRNGRYEPLLPQPAWDGNPSHGRFVAALWRSEDDARFLLVVNLAPTRGQARLRFAAGEGSLRLSDRFGNENYRRDRGEIARGGLFVDLPPWGGNLFALEPG
ncbi:MAG: alpha-amylase [Gluconacetobacter diazotrophicus]|nr:alpha-amylase [Gluconacetobacter diazotrophicus]